MDEEKPKNKAGGKGEVPDPSAECCSHSNRLGKIAPLSSRDSQAANPDQILPSISRDFGQFGFDVALEAVAGSLRASLTKQKAAPCL